MQEAPQKPESELEEAARTTSSSMFVEWLAYLSHTRKWWLVPFVLVLLLTSGLLLLSGSSVAPFIYTLF